jgi:hypothetical protein
MVGIIVKCFEQVKPFLIDLFDGVTEEELRRSKISDIADIFINIYKYVTNELGAVVVDQKN